MKTVGVIAEYNPFHNGHFYHLAKARQETGADYLVAVMSGDFTQRGAPALADKYIRAQMALLCGADLVLELPVIHATASASYFARGAVSLLHNLGVVDYLCFGNESGSPEIFSKIGSILRQELPRFKKSLQNALGSGQSFPAARHQALLGCLESFLPPEGLLDSPNNILGLEYCIALQDFESPIRPLAIRRIESDYHQTELGKHYSSATAIRREILNGSLFSAWSSHIPAHAAEILKHTLSSRGTIQENDFSLLLKYKCMEMPPEELCRFFDVSKEMANRIHKHLNDFTCYQDFTALIKTREITYTRAARGLLHILLNLYPPTPALPVQEITPYARLLGFRENAAPLLARIKKAGGIPLLSRPAKFLKDNRLLDARARAMLTQDVHAANLYESVLAYKSNTPFVHEFCQPIIRVSS